MNASWNNSSSPASSVVLSTAADAPSSPTRHRGGNWDGSCNRKPRRRGTGAYTLKGHLRHYARHDYHDHSDLVPDDVAKEMSLKPPRGGVQTTFPQLLHNVLEAAEEGGYDDVISWQPHGRAFRIHNRKRFDNEILPQHFHNQKKQSFLRQLSLYGFNRLTRDSCDRGGYYHECFLRGREFLCSKIERTRIKGTWVRKASSPEAEPDFYLMPEVQAIGVVEQDRARQAQTAFQPEKFLQTETVDVATDMNEQQQPNLGNSTSAVASSEGQTEADIRFERLMNMLRNGPTNHVPVVPAKHFGTAAPVFEERAFPAANVPPTQSSASRPSNSTPTSTHTESTEAAPALPLPPTQPRLGGKRIDVLARSYSQTKGVTSSPNQTLPPPSSSTLPYKLNNRNATNVSPSSTLNAPEHERVDTWSCISDIDLDDGLFDDFDIETFPFEENDHDRMISSQVAI